MYERVLIPLDGSEPAEAILPCAERIAGPADAEICLLRVVEPARDEGIRAGSRRRDTWPRWSAGWKAGDCGSGRS